MVLCYAHLDLVIINKAIRKPLIRQVEVACLKYLINEVTAGLLDRLHIDTPSLSYRTMEVMEQPAEYIPEHRALDKNAFAPDTEFETYDEDQAVAMLRGRVQTMLCQGFDISPTLQCATISRQLMFDRFMASDNPSAKLMANGDAMTRVLPCVFASIAILYGSRDDAKLAFHQLSSHVIPSISDDDDRRVWNPLLFRIDDKRLPWDTDHIQTLIQTVGQTMCYYLDEKFYRPPALKTSSLTEQQFWLSLDSYQMSKDIGNYPKLAVQNMADFVQEKTTFFVEKMRLLQSRLEGADAIISDKKLAVISQAIENLLFIRPRIVAWRLYDESIRGILLRMWQIIHLSGIFLDPTQPSVATTYVRAFSAFSSHILSRIEETSTVVQYEGYVIGTFVDHDKAIHRFGESFGKSMYHPTAFTTAYKKYGRASHERIRLLLHAYMQTMGEKWFGERWDTIFQELLSICADIIRMHGSTLPSMVCNLGHEPVVPPWHWMAIYQQNASSCRISFKRPFARPFGSFHHCTDISRNYVRLFRAFHKMNA